MKTITLTLPGITFPNVFKTAVVKVVDPAGNSRIVLDHMPHAEISLGGARASDLGIEQYTQVTITPVTNSKTGEFVLSIGEKVEPKKTTGVQTRGNSPLPDFKPSNALG
jgi:hypothetical protein